jgi:hypothetical protein
MSQTVLLKRSAVPGRVPTSDFKITGTPLLTLGEVGLNTYDGKVYITQEQLGIQTIKEIGGDQFPTQPGNVGKFLKTNGTSVLWSSSGGTSTNVLQNVHGFIIGNVLRYDGAAYVLANASSGATSDVVGIVTSVMDANNFELTSSGVINGLSSLSPSASYFLSDTVSGSLTITEPTAIGSISKPLLIALTASTGLFYNWRGIANVNPIEINALLPSQSGQAGSVLISDGTSVGWVSVAAATASINVVQTGHGFVIGSVVKATNNPSIPYAAAQANNAANAQVFGIVSAVSLTGYSVTTSGIVSSLISLVQGTLYYLSDASAGTLTPTEPTTTTSISKPLFIATSATTGIFFNQRGIVVGVATATPSQLLPVQTGQSGKFLTTNGLTPSWASVVAGVSSFNTRTGAVTLTSLDVTGALGFTPANKAGDTFTGSVAVQGTVQATGKFLAAEGVGAQGGYTFTVDGAQDTGMFSPSDGALDFYANGINIFNLRPGAPAYVAGVPVMTGNRTVSTAAASGAAGVGDIWYQY